MEQASSPKREHDLVGPMLLVAAGALWSLNGALIKLTFSDGGGPDGLTIAFYRSLFAGLFLAPFARGKMRTLLRSTTTTAIDSAGRARLPRVRPAAISCVIFFTLMTLSFVIANTKTEAANAIILQYTSTFWIFGLSPLVLRERPHLRDCWYLLVAMIGIAIIFAGNAGTDLVGLVIAMTAGFFFSLLTMMIRLMRDCDSAAVAVANNLGSAILLLPAVLLFGDLFVDRRSLVLLLIMGVVQFGLPYYLYTLALARVPAYKASLLTMIEPVLVPVWTYLAVGELVPRMTILGGSLILVSLVLFLRSSARRPVEAVG